MLDDRAVDLVVVDTDLLGEALGNNSAFEAFHLTHGLLQLEDPHVADHVRTRRQEDGVLVPGGMGEEGGEFRDYG